MSEATTYLELRDLRVSYGKVEALHGISVHVEQGEIVTILGANGAGKTTTLTTISGLRKPSGGSILFQGRPLHTIPSHEIVRLGITQSPEGRRVFGTLSVRENLDLGAFTSKDRGRSAKIRKWIFDLFPRLAEREGQLAGTLSGGEQQMLAIARALMADPKVLLLDEPSLGLAPLLVRSIFDSVRRDQPPGRDRHPRGAERPRRPEARLARLRHRSGQGRHGRRLGSAARQSGRAGGLPWRRAGKWARKLSPHRRNQKRNAYSVPLLSLPSNLLIRQKSPYSFLESPSRLRCHAPASAALPLQGAAFKRAYSPLALLREALPARSGGSAPFRGVPILP